MGDRGPSRVRRARRPGRARLLRLARLIGKESRHARQEALDLAEKMALEQRVQFIVVDSESQGAVSFGLAEKLATNLNAEYFKIQDLKANQLVDIARGGLL